MELAEKVFKTQSYNYAKTFLDLVIKSFEEKQIKRDAENAKLAVLDNTEANARKKVLQEVLVHLYECRDDLTRESVIDNQTSAIIAFGFGENGLELQDAYFDVTGNVQFDEKNPAHQLCKITIDQISEVFEEDKKWNLWMDMLL